jgi:nucleotide-binding universal stress UspA family protein
MICGLLSSQNTIMGGKMKILLATDGSEYSRCAAEFLTRMNWSADDSIKVFHAIYAIPFRYDEKFHFSTLKAIKKDIAPRVLDAAVAVLKSVHARISVEIEEGSPNQCTPEQCIIDAAESSGADAIVMGARGIKGIESVFVGSVTRLVTIKSSKPVLVVKPTVRIKSDKMKILFATDDSDYSRATREFLSAIPFPDNAEVVILTVLSSNFSDIPERFVMEIDERIKEVVASTRSREFTESEKIVEQARDRLIKRFKNISVLSKVGDPSTEILKTAESMEADIIAVGCRGLRGIKEILGSVSRNILTHSKCSVLIGKPRKE